MGERVTVQRRVVAVRDGGARTRPDRLVVEEPMEVRVNGETAAVTMRTPGDDFDLALGFCLTEGLVEPADVAGMRYCAGKDETGRNTYNVVEVVSRSRKPLAEELRRNLYTTSSCGLCGATSLEVVRKRTRPVAGDPLPVSATLLSQLPDRLRAAQRVFGRTGGLHATGLFDSQGGLVCVREDVGRHNAVDKVIGWAATQRALPLSGHILMVSGRVAFEIAQKALWAGVPVLAAVSAPSSLAVELADEAGMTLVGFLRGSTMNIYAGEDRVLVDAGPPASDDPTEPTPPARAAEPDGGVAGDARRDQ